MMELIIKKWSLFKHFEIILYKSVIVPMFLLLMFIFCLAKQMSIDLWYLSGKRSVACNRLSHSRMQNSGKEKPDILYNRSVIITMIKGWTVVKDGQ